MEASSFRAPGTPETVNPLMSKKWGLPFHGFPGASLAVITTQINDFYRTRLNESLCDSFVMLSLLFRFTPAELKAKSLASQGISLLTFGMTVAVIACHVSACIIAARR
eukprot:88557-Amphidinium_carterae.1